MAKLEENAVGQTASDTDMSATQADVCVDFHNDKNRPDAQHDEADNLKAQQIKEISMSASTNEIQETNPGREFIVPEFKELREDLGLAASYEEVRKDCSVLLKGELMMSGAAICVSHKIYSLFQLVMKSTEPKKLLESWCYDRGFTKTELRGKRESALLCKSVMFEAPPQRVSDEKRVLDAAVRYSNNALNGQSMSQKEFIEWGDNCGGLTNIRRGAIPVELGGTKNNSTRKTPSEILHDRKKAVVESPTIARVPFSPSGAGADDIVIFYGVVHGNATELKLACALPVEKAASKNVHGLKIAELLHDGEPLLSHNDGGDIVMVAAENTTTAEDVMSKAAEMAS